MILPTIDRASSTGGWGRYSEITGTKEDTYVDLSCSASCFFFHQICNNIKGKYENQQPRNIADVN